MVNRFSPSRWPTAMILIFGVSLLVCSATADVFAATPTSTNARSVADAGQKPDSKVALPEPDHKIEAAALNLVNAHLPELKGVLDRLRGDQPRQYDRAVRDLAKSAKKLDTIKKRDERHYELEVELLKAQTEVNLLTAKLKVRDSQPDRKLLRGAVARLQQASIARSEYEVQLLQQRLERTTQQLAAANDQLAEKRTDLDEQLEKSFLSLLRKAGRQSDADTPVDKEPSTKSKKK